MFDGLYQPKSLTLTRQGLGVHWTDDQGTHTVTDAMSLGFDGTMAAPLRLGAAQRPGRAFLFTFFRRGDRTGFSAGLRRAPAAIP